MPFFYSLQDSRTEAICLDLLARHGPRLLRQGPTHLSREHLMSGRRITEEARQKIRERAAKGGSLADIAADCGWSTTTVFRVIKNQPVARP